MKALRNAAMQESGHSSRRTASRTPDMQKRENWTPWIKAKSAGRTPAEQKAACANGKNGNVRCPCASAPVHVLDGPDKHRILAANDIVNVILKIDRSKEEGHHPAQGKAHRFN